MSATNPAPQKSTESIRLKPRLDGAESAFSLFCRDLSDVLEKNPENRIRVIEKTRSGLAASETLPDSGVKLAFAKSVVLDLLTQGWKLSIDEQGNVEVAPPVLQNADEKDQIRRSHLWGRDAQLKERSVREFVNRMERKRLTPAGWRSIFSLMRDGRELANRLASIATLPTPEERSRELSRSISPYLQFVEPDSVCEHTGLRLGDIWRYFRHTWTSEYKSVPGRLVMILVRDAAAENHPVIGIAALGSSVVQHRLRDEWIGWQADTFVNNIEELSATGTVRWLLDCLDRLISDIYTGDLSSVCAPSEMKTPTPGAISRLLVESENAIRKHRENPQRSRHSNSNSAPPTNDLYLSEAKSHLYRSKRCKQLARLLEIRSSLTAAGVIAGASPKRLREALRTPVAKRSIARLIRMIKGEHVGIDMMDITVCGAVAPYGPILGGKLVCMLLGSSEVTEYYNKKYAGQPSVIASAMKGSTVIRQPNLVLLCTTSLYGKRSSQYNRISIPLESLGINSTKVLKYEDLGSSVGYGTYHFSNLTIKFGQILNSRQRQQLVNSIFGEGVNPLMRKIRESLGLIGFDQDQLLRHGNQRITYGVVLAENYRDILLGLSKKPKYLIPQKRAKEWTRSIAIYWQQRWLTHRILREEVIEAVSLDTLDHPIKHGARVRLPDCDTEQSLYQ